MTSNSETRFAAFFAAIACAFLTIGFSVAPAVTSATVLVA